MRKLTVVVLVVVLGAGMAAPQAAWAMVTLLRVGTTVGTIQIDGESTIQGHENEIVVEALYFGVSTPAVVGAVQQNAP